MNKNLLVSIFMLINVIMFFISKTHISIFDSAILFLLYAAINFILIFEIYFAYKKSDK